MLVRVIKSWNFPDLMRQTPGASGCWDGIRFTNDPVDKCDAVIVLNYLQETTQVDCPPSNVWVLMQEPYIPGVFDWVVEGHDQYSRVFTHHPGRFDQKRYIRSQPAVPWHVNKCYDELKKLAPPIKQKFISSIASNIMSFPGHKIRAEFLEYLQAQSLAVDFYGKGTNYIENKWDGLAPYRYSLAIENSSSPDYWTEKVADCFLSWTVPIYYGCTNLEDYFPPGAFIRIDITQPGSALEIIATTLANDDWDARIPALEEARNLVLDRYQFFPQMRKVIEQNYIDRPSKNLLLRPYCERRNLFQELQGYLSRLVRNL